MSSGIAAWALSSAIAAATGGGPTEPLTAWLTGVATSAQALADGDPAAAEVAARGALAASPAGPRVARADLALGLALRDGGRFAEAATALARAAGALGDPALAARARLGLAEALFYAGHPGAAAPLFAEAARAPGAAAPRARWREADALLAAGAAAAAARAYDRLTAADPGDPATPGARLALGTARREAGDAAGAVTAWRALAREQPADAAGRAAARALSAWRREGGPVPPAAPDERLARAGRLLELALPRRVLAAMDRFDAAAPQPEAATRGALLRAFALVQLGRYPEAQAIAERLVAAPAAIEGTRLGADLVLARVAARTGRIDEASARYRQLSRSAIPIPGLPPAQARDLPEEAAFLSAYLYYDAGRYGRAVELLRAFAREHPRARRAEDARWFEAWSLVHLGRRGEARRALERLAHGGLEPQARYWLARLGDRRERRALYRRALSAAPPGSWYALLSAARLAAEGERPPPPPPAAAPAPIPDGPGDGAGGEAVARAARLAGAGLAADAIAELRAAIRVRAHPAVVAQLAAALGDAELPFRLARDQLAPTQRARRWLYPLAFPDLLPAAAREAGVDPSLYLAVMRRESAFRPDARSGAGAIGLVQLIPPTAERLAAVEGVRAGSVRHLEDPAVSVPLGAAYLGLLAERFGDPAVVLAAYNAGPAAAAAWAASRAGVPLDVFAEDIPYRETRRYVKNVLADAAAFGALWQGRPLALDGERRIPAPREGVGF